MTKERLKELSFEQLQGLSRKMKLDFSINEDKETLVENILEAIQEDNLEREELNNLATQMESHKYDVALIEELFTPYDEEEELAESYNQDRIVLMLREPSWGFAYWDISNQVKQELEEDEGFEGLTLRLVELSDNYYHPDSIIDFFDITTTSKHGQRYFNLPSEEAYYGAELIALSSQNERVLMRSNIINTTRTFIVPSINENQKSDMLIELSGFSRDETAYPGKKLKVKYPQRIIPIAKQEEEAENE